MNKQISLILALVLILNVISFVNADTIPIDSYSDIRSSDQQKPTPEKSQAEKDCLKKGCFDKYENKCQPYGYIKDGKYCSDKAIVYGSSIYRSGFVNQSETGASCIQSYECKTGVCSNGFCINLTEQQIKIERLEANINYLSQEDLETKNSSANSGNFVPEVNPTVAKKKSISQRINNFLKNLFS